MPAGTAFLAAVSGGADSAAMLAALVSLRDEPAGRAFDLRCIHVEHGIRPPEESRGDADFVCALCAQFDVPCAVVSIPPGKIAAKAKREGIGIEAAARLYRRRALLREARRIAAGRGGPVRILTAHTARDALETVLMRVLRGAGPAGLAAMPASRGLFLRPLLALDRADALRYLAEKNIPWREDSTNADTRFLRNRIRRRLIPLLDESFPHWKSGLAALAETQALAAGFIRAEARRRVRWTARETAAGSVLCTGAENFFAQSAIIREEALFRGIDRLLAGTAANSVPVRRAALRRFCAGLVSAADLGPLEARRKKQRVILGGAGNAVSERGFALLIKEPGLYTLKETTIEARSCSGTRESRAEEGAFFALLPLVLRPALKGDYLVRNGRKTAPSDVAAGPLRKRLWAAADPMGTAAFIGPESLLADREFPGEAARIKITMQFAKGRQFKNV